MNKNSFLFSLPCLLIFCGCVASDTTSKSLYEARVDSVNDMALIAESSEDGKLKTPPPRLEVVTGEFDLLKVVNTALSNNLSLRAAMLRRSEAAGAVTEARAAALPNLALNGGVTSDVVERGDNPETYDATLSLTQPLWRSGAISAGVRYADIYAANVDEEIRAEIQGVVAQVASDYLAVLLSKEMVDVYTESVAVAERMLDTAKTKRKAGTASDYEVLRAEVEVASSKASLIKEQNAMRTAGIRLLQGMGVDQASRIQIAGALKYEPETNDVDSVIVTALMNRPDLLCAQADVAMAQESLKLVKSEYGFAVDLFAKGSYKNPDPNDGDDSWGHDASAGINIAIDIFDGFERRGKLRQAESRLRQAKAELHEAEETARVEVVRALLDVRNADELYLSQSKNIDLSREALRMLENGFKVGRNTQIEVLDAHSALIEAMGQYYNAIYSHCIARIGVLKAAGTLVISGGTTILEDGIQLAALPF